MMRATDSANLARAMDAGDAGRSFVDQFVAQAAHQEADAERLKRVWLRHWLEISFIPPLAAFALSEGLLWAVRGFSETKH